ncbi:hypothetical protein BH11PLA2_BH11PLA2_18920 [soil metagenome]
MRIQVVSATAFAMMFLVAARSDAQSLLAQYHFNESGGPTAFDATGSFNGSLSSTGASFVPGGISGNALDLNRPANGLVNVGNVLGSTASGNLSVVLWVKTTTMQIDTLVLSKHATGSNNGYFVHVNANFDGGAANKATFVASQTPGNSPTSSLSVNDGNWHQIVGVFQAGVTESIYVDGQFQSSSPAAAAIVANSAPFLFGGATFSGTPTALYSGQLDEVQIYNGILSQAQITALYNSPATPVPEPILTLVVAACFVSTLVASPFRRTSSCT